MRSERTQRFLRRGVNGGPQLRKRFARRTVPSPPAIALRLSIHPDRHLGFQPSRLAPWLSAFDLSVTIDPRLDLVMRHLGIRPELHRAIRF